MSDAQVEQRVGAEGRGCRAFSGGKDCERTWCRVHAVRSNSARQKVVRLSLVVLAVAEAFTFARGNVSATRA
jgi:hypothetical protein